jgi:superfamily II DNA/RNA helicase
MGQAQTGTGKTAAFVLPMLHRFDEMSKKQGNRTRTYPYTHAGTCAASAGVDNNGGTSYKLFITLRFTAVSVWIISLRRLRRGVDIVVATPGRLLDHLNRVEQ